MFGSWKRPYALGLHDIIEVIHISICGLSSFFDLLCNITVRGDCHSEVLKSFHSFEVVCVFAFTTV